MFVSPIVNYGYHYFNSTKKKSADFSSSKLLPSNNDVFVRSENPVFKSTSAGAPLKNLANITDPYFGIILITISEFVKAEKLLNTKSNVRQAVTALLKYKENMQVVEKAIFERFLAEAKHYPKKKFNDLLQEWYPRALTKLKLEEFKILDEIDKLSLNLDPETTFEVRKQTTYCRQLIIDDNPEKRFKRKTVISSLEKIEPKPGEEETLKKLINMANYLPASNTSINAFIVKYADRKHNEIAKRLIRASVQSIEHIHPDSLGGENILENFMLASSSANSLRGNMPLKDFIAMYPQVLKNCQLYINDIIEVIHNGGLKGHQTYPYKVKQTLYRESEGLINLDLSKYKYTYNEAEKLEKRKYGYKVPDKSKKNSKKTKSITKF